MDHAVVVQAEQVPRGQQEPRRGGGGPRHGRVPAPDLFPVRGAGRICVERALLGVAAQREPPGPGSGGDRCPARDAGRRALLDGDLFEEIGEAVVGRPDRRKQPVAVDDGRLAAPGRGPHAQQRDHVRVGVAVEHVPVGVRLAGRAAVSVHRAGLPVEERGLPGDGVGGDADRLAVRSQPSGQYRAGARDGGHGVRPGLGQDHRAVPPERLARLDGARAAKGRETPLFRHDYSPFWLVMRSVAWPSLSLTPKKRE